MEKESGFEAKLVGLGEKKSDVGVERRLRDWKRVEADSNSFNAKAKDVPFDANRTEPEVKRIDEDLPKG